jgi:uncharacterized membrane protein
MPPYLLRLAYVSQFLLALIAVWTVWSQVGGQEHLDLMPWHAKLALSVSLSWVVVMGTMAAVSGAGAWNRKVLFYLLAGLCIAAGMAVLTYYYHLHEDDECEDDSATTTALMRVAPAPRQ